MKSGYQRQVISKDFFKKITMFFGRKIILLPKRFCSPHHFFIIGSGRKCKKAPHPWFKTTNTFLSTVTKSNLIKIKLTLFVDLKQGFQTLL